MTAPWVLGLWRPTTFRYRNPDSCEICKGDPGAVEEETRGPFAAEATRPAPCCPGCGYSATPSIRGFLGQVS